MFRNRKADAFVVEQAVDEIRRLKQEAEERFAASLEEIKRLEQDYVSRLNNAKYELSKDVIEQANAPISKVVSLLTFIIAVIVCGVSILTFFVSNNLQSAFEVHMKQRVESWLSLDDEDSIASKTLDSYRTRALLDSYMIQLVRRKASGDSLIHLDFKKGDEKRLLSIIESPGSELSDFYDALRLLSVSRGEWAFAYQNDEVSRRLRNIFQESDIDINRKLDILEIMERDSGLIPVASAYIKDPKQPPEFRRAAFNMLKLYPHKSASGGLAYAYALERLNGEDDAIEMSEVVKYIAGTDPFNPVLNRYLDGLQSQPRDVRIIMRLAIAEGWISLLPYSSIQLIPEDEIRDQPVDREIIREKIAAILSSAIDDGLYLEVTDNLSGKPYLSAQFSSTPGSDTLVRFPLDRLFEDSKLIRRLFDIRGVRDGANFAKFFNTTYKGEVVTSIRVELPAEVLPSSDHHIVGHIVTGQLKVSSSNALIFAWKDEAGELRETSLTTLAPPEGIKILFDRSYLVSDTRTYLDWIF